uniref:Nucleoporin NSP1-like C-terminal domain-containing protein n=1 Tax=Ananas comosus var. bracteatus TaxID=296719 RepID=A0A6V7QWS5_ANACO
MILMPLMYARPTTSTTSTTSQAPKLPSEIAGKVVEEIIRDWNNELQERTTKFRKQATAIAEWDRRILQNRNVLIRLEAEVAKVVETQNSLERQLELIETHQKEVDKALQSMEEEAERTFQDERALLLEDDAAFARDSMYEQAEFVERELQHMTEQVKSIIQTLNATQGADLDAADGLSPFDVAVRILNNQLRSLMWIDEKANEFSGRIQKLANHGAALERDSTGRGLWLK